LFTCYRQHRSVYFIKLFHKEGDIFVLSFICCAIFRAATFVLKKNHFFCNLKRGFFSLSMQFTCLVETCKQNEASRRP
jgi:hypothetical protein